MNDHGPSQIADPEVSTRCWLAPFLIFWAVIFGVGVFGYSITPEHCKGPFGLGQTAILGWGLAGLLASIPAGWLSEFIVESPLLSRVSQKTRIWMAILTALLISAGAIYLGRLGIVDYCHSPWT